MAILDDTRSDWDARPPNGTLRTVPWDQRVGVSWHWIGPGRGIPASASHTLCLDLVNRWQLQHQTRPGDPWKDIGYNALICQHARAIEGRGLDKAGSHSPGVNWEHVGIQYMTGSDGITPTTQMVARAQFLRADLGDLGKNIRRDWGHRDDPAASTTCPGNWIETWVKVGGPTASTTKDWFDMATPAELEAVVRKVLNDPVVLRNIAKYVAEGYPMGPEGDKKVLAGWLTQLDQLTRIAIVAASEEPSAEEVAAAVQEAIASSVTVSGELTVTPKEPTA
jgi:hypothetical protein